MLRFLITFNCHAKNSWKEWYQKSDHAAHEVVLCSEDMYSGRSQTVSREGYEGVTTHTI